MQFNLKNIVKNLLSIYDTISIEDKNISEKKIHNKKLNILVKKFISYLISNEYKFTKIEIAEILKISRGKLYRILS